MGRDVRAVGIDPGTVSFDVFGIESGPEGGVEGERVFLDTSLPSAQIKAEPKSLLEVLHAAGPVDMIVGPSGYGLPWTRAEDLSPAQVDLLLLSGKQADGPETDTIIGGMRKLVYLLQESGLPIRFVPAVIHLPTVPPHRKVNRIDMGTADKLCAVVLGVYDQARHLGIPFAQTSFIYLELGGAFTAVVAVQDGKIVDGQGGSSGSLGYRAMGAMDGELAYLLGRFSKGTLCSGGMAHIAGQPDLPAPDLAALVQTDARAQIAWHAFFEGLTKQVAAEMTVVPAPREILISGRLCHVPAIRQELTRRLSDLAPVRRVRGFPERYAKEAAQGAALIAEGLAGGRYRDLVEVMALRQAQGTVLDHLYVSGAEALKKKYGPRLSRRIGSSGSLKH